MKHVLIRYTVALALFLVPGLQKVAAQIRLMGMVTDADTRAGLAPSVSGINAPAWVP